MHLRSSIGGADADTGEHIPRAARPSAAHMNHRDGWKQLLNNRCLLTLTTRVRQTPLVLDPTRAFATPGPVSTISACS